MIKEDKLALIMGDKTKEMCESWYENILASDARYVVFIEPRCYNLALVMESITNKKMIDTAEKEFLTADVFLSRCEELATYFQKYGRFPKILICNDILKYASYNINSFLFSLEHRLEELLCNNKNFECEYIINKLVVKTTIYSLERINLQTILIGRYEMKAKFTDNVRKEIYEINELTHKIANVTYDISKDYTGITINSNKELYSELENSSRYKAINYRNHKTYHQIEYAQNQNFIKAIYVTRFFRERNNDEEYKINSSIFLPTLNKKELDGIKKDVFLKLKQDNRWENIESEIEKWYHLEDKQLFYEWLILLMNQALLKNVAKKHNIDINENGDPYKNELLRLVRHYNSFGFEKTVEILNFTLNQNVLEFEELNSILLKNIKEHHIVQLSDKKREIKTKEQIKLLLEDYIYNEIFEFEEKSKKTSAIHHLPELIYKRQQTPKSLNLILKEANISLSVEELEYFIAYILKMLDSGLITISSHTLRDDKNITFEQAVKADQLALQIYPLRIYEYIPMLCRAEKRCEQNALNFENELLNYFNSEDCDVAKEEQIQILKYVSQGLKINQVAVAWITNYLDNVDFEDEKEEKQLVHIIRFMKRQTKHTDQYISYDEKIKR